MVTLSTFCERKVMVRDGVARQKFMIAGLLALALVPVGEMADVFASAGLSYKSTSKAQGVLTAYGAEWRVLGEFSPEKLTSISLARMVQTRNYVTQAALANWSAGPGESWETSLDHCVFGEVTLSLEGFKEKAPGLKVGLDALNARWKSLQATFPIQQNLRYGQWWQPTKTPPLNAALEVFHLGERDFAYLREVCGWNFKGPTGGSSSTWFVPIGFGKEIAFISPRLQNMVTLPGFRIGTGQIETIRPFSGDEIQQINKKLKHSTMGTSASPKHVVAERTVEFPSPVSLRKVIAAVNEFGRDLAVLRRELDAMSDK